MGRMQAAYSRVVPLLAVRSGLPEGLVPVALGAFGTGALIGTLLGGWLGDRLPRSATLAGAAAMLATVVVICLAADSLVPTVVLVAVLDFATMTVVPVLVALAVR